ncbi:MAG: translesion error-prone DNA polymerase V autoproteolytic subunit [Rickettsiaceae bacterium]|nr:translesion error-prone DNA polymerase V autoproteolytic subunit [Rickettsiaceae bacterium]
MSSKKISIMKKRGGKREGAGRPKGIGKYSCTTKPIRVPVDMIEVIDHFIRSSVKQESEIHSEKVPVSGIASDFANMNNHSMRQSQIRDQFFKGTNITILGSYNSIGISGSFAKKSIKDLDEIGNRSIIGDNSFANENNIHSLPLYSGKVAAGFPSPADDYMDTRLNLNEYLIQRPASSFFVRVTGESMIGAGINNGDILVVDRSLEPRHNKIVIAAVNSELTVKRLYKKEGLVKLVAENPNYKDIIIGEIEDLVIWGVVTTVIHQFL